MSEIFNVLAIGTHPDDIEFGCGGTLRKLADNGCIITNVLVTSGGEGGRNIGAAQLCRIREEEALCSL
jgi:LmbE family N-acetylglucosaminyl deacetylase